MHVTCYIVCGYVAMSIKKLQDVCMYACNMLYCVRLRGYKYKRASGCMYACKSKAYSGWGMYA